MLLEKIQMRAQLLNQIRTFFSQRNVLEVETPILSQHTVTDIYIESFSTEYKSGDFQQIYYLQTSLNTP